MRVELVGYVALPRQHSESLAHFSQPFRAQLLQLPSKMGIAQVDSIDVRGPGHSKAGKQLAHFLRGSCTPTRLARAVVDIVQIQNVGKGFTFLDQRSSLLSKFSERTLQRRSRAADVHSCKFGQESNDLIVHIALTVRHSTQVAAETFVGVERPVGLVCNRGPRPAEPDDRIRKSGSRPGEGPRIVSASNAASPHAGPQLSADPIANALRLFDVRKHHIAQGKFHRANRATNQD